jgi:hypothetical protein
MPFMAMSGTAGCGKASTAGMAASVAGESCPAEFMIAGNNVAAVVECAIAESALTESIGMSTHRPGFAFKVVVIPIVMVWPTPSPSVSIIPGRRSPPFVGWITISATVNRITITGTVRGITITSAVISTWHLNTSRGSECQHNERSNRKHIYLFHVLSLSDGEKRRGQNVAASISPP